MKQYEIKIDNVNGVFFPAIKGDTIDSVNIHLVFTYKKDEKNKDNMLLERINMDYSMNYYSIKTGNYFPVNTSLFLLFYDYENPFNPPFFKEKKMPSDYVKIWAFPYMDAFWKYNYFLPEDKKKEERLRFFEKNGIVKNQKDSPFNPDVEELKSPLQAWSKERVDLERMTINSMFSGPDGKVFAAADFVDLKKLKMNDASYNVDAQIFMDYFCVNDSMFFTTKSLINLETSYFLATPNAYAAAYVNMYFDLYEMSRRNLEKRLKQLSGCNPKEMEKIYAEEMKILNDNIRKYKNGTKDATEILTLINWWSIINDSLHIEQSLLDKPIRAPKYLFDKDELMLFPTYFHNTGLVLLQLGQYQEAVNYFTIAIEKILVNKKNQSKVAHFYFRRAEAYYYLELINLCCDDLHHAISLDSSIKEYAKQYLKYCETE
jgi:tetratricopeptide (TPR) repeat protein